MSGWSRFGGGACLLVVLALFRFGCKTHVFKTCAGLLCFSLFLRGMGRVSPPKNGEECQSGG